MNNCTQLLRVAQIIYCAPPDSVGHSHVICKLIFSDSTVLVFSKHMHFPQWKFLDFCPLTLPENFPISGPIIILEIMC